MRTSVHVKEKCMACGREMGNVIQGILHEGYEMNVTCGYCGKRHTVLITNSKEGVQIDMIDIVIWSGGYDSTLILDQLCSAGFDMVVAYPFVKEGEFLPLNLHVNRILPPKCVTTDQFMWLKRFMGLANCRLRKSVR